MDGSLSPQWATAEPTLQIPSVSFEDEGTYECEAENSKGRDTVQGRIIVQGTEPETPPFSLRKQHEKSRDWKASPLPGLLSVVREAIAELSRAIQKARVFQEIWLLKQSLAQSQSASFLLSPHLCLSIPEYQQRPLLSCTNTATF